MKRFGFSFFSFYFTVFFLYIPLAVLTLFSFNEASSMAWTGFSLRWYRDLFLNSDSLWLAFGNTLLIGLSAAFFATIIGTAGAIGLTWYRFRFKNILQGLTYLPMVIPEIIIGVALLIVFVAVGVPLGLFSIFLAHTTFCLPFAFLIVSARLGEFDFSVIEASYDLGAGEWQTLVRVILPMAFPGILSAFLMSLTLSLEDFVITFFVSGPGSSTLAVHIFSMIRFGVSPVINALSVILLLGTASLAFFSRPLFRFLISK
jgi:spermidine/putrescine transport system permease protein